MKPQYPGALPDSCHTCSQESNREKTVKYTMDAKSFSDGKAVTYCVLLLPR
jgi:hypothetical protein